MKPSDIPEWASDLTNVVEPPDSQKESGWNYQQIPPSNFQNWWQNLVYQWIVWLDNATNATAEQIRLNLTQSQDENAPIEMSSESSTAWALRLSLAAGSVKIRVYSGSSGFMITRNARWLAGSANFQADSGVQTSVMLRLVGRLLQTGSKVAGAANWTTWDQIVELGDAAGVAAVDANFSGAVGVGGALSVTGAIGGSSITATTAVTSLGNVVAIGDVRAGGDLRYGSTQSRVKEFGFGGSIFPAANWVSDGVGNYVSTGASAGALYWQIPLSRDVTLTALDLAINQVGSGDAIVSVVSRTTNWGTGVVTEATIGTGSQTTPTTGQSTFAIALPGGGIPIVNTHIQSYWVKVVSGGTPSLRMLRLSWDELFLRSY